MRFNPFLAFALAGLADSVLSLENLYSPSGKFAPSQPAFSYQVEEANYVYGPGGLVYSLESSVSGLESIPTLPALAGR